MTKQEAAEILKAHNIWRRRRDDEPQPMPYSCELLGVAIDVAVAILDSEEDVS